MSICRYSDVVIIIVVFTYDHRSSRLRTGRFHFPCVELHVSPAVGTCSVTGCFEFEKMAVMMPVIMIKVYTGRKGKAGDHQDRCQDAYQKSLHKGPPMKYEYGL